MRKMVEIAFDNEIVAARKRLIASMQEHIQTHDSDAHQATVVPGPLVPVSARSAPAASPAPPASETC